MSENRQKTKEKINIFKTVMFFITLGIVPLFVYYSVTPSGPEELYLIPNSMEKTDMFSYYKSWLFAICTIILGMNSLWDFIANNLDFDYKRALKNPFILVYALFFVVIMALGIVNNFSGGGPAPSNQTAQFVFMMVCYTAIFLPHLFIASFHDKFKTHIPKPVAIAAVVFLMTVFVTSALTDYRYMTYHGAIERCESVFALLGYIIILVEIADFASRERESKIVFGSLIFSAVVICAIAFFQLLGMDFFNTETANRLVLGQAYQEGVRLAPRFNIAYSTLYNPNCVGMYSAMMGPLTFAAAILWPKKSPMKYILFVTAVLSVFCLFGSNSSAGLLGSFAGFGSLVLIVLANFIKNRKNMKPFAIIAVLAGVAVAGAMFVPAIGSRVMQMAQKIITLPQTDEERGYLRDFEVDGATVRLISEQNSISVTNEDGQIIIRDTAGQIREADQIESAEDGNGGTAYYTGLENWADFALSTYLATVSYEEDGGFSLYLGVDGMGNLLPLTKKGEVVDIDSPPPSIGFENYQHFASSRGYIWSKTFPLVFNQLLKGTGVDSFIMAFPQNDLLGKARFFANPYIIVDKPHNMYLQTAVNTGLISLLAQVSMFAIFLYWAVKKLVTIPKMNTPFYATLLGTTVGVVGYLVTGLSTDSTVSVAPMFWAVLGLGYACIYALDHNHE